MCVDTVTEQYWPYLATEREAYKVLDSVDGDYVFPCRNYVQPVLFDKWMRATDGRSLTGGPIGFHVFVSKRDAMAWYLFDESSHVFRVKVRGIRAIGREDGSAVLIASEMYVPTESEMRDGE